MNDRDFQVWADKIDNRPSYATRTSGRILSMKFAGVERRSRQVPPWEISARRRRYELRLMEARMRMEELV
jgi:hypothetical protein